jgi:hypothetical protein
MARNADKTKDRITVTRELGGPGRVTIYWEVLEGETEWTAHRMIPSRPHTRMAHLDAPDMLTVFKYVRDILVGTIDEELMAA